MYYKTRVFRSVREIGPDCWETFNVNSCYLSYEWLGMLEVYFKPWVYYVAVSTENDQIVALAPCYKMSDPAMNASYNVRKLLAGSDIPAEIMAHLPEETRQEQAERANVIHHLEDRQFFPSLLCSGMQGYVSSPLFHQDVATDALPVVAQALIEATIKLGNDLGCPTTAFLYMEPANPLTPLLKQREYLRVAMEPEAYLKLAWEDFDQYLQSLHRKRQARREVRRFAESGLKVDVKSLAELPATRLATLLRNIQVKYHVEEGDVSDYQAYIEQQLKRIALQNVVYTASVGEEIVAFALFFRYKDALFGRIVGADHTQLQNDFCYFNIAFYQPIARAFQQGIQRIHYGTAAMEAKVARGSSIITRYGYFYLHASSKDAVLRSSADIVTLAREQAITSLRAKTSCEILTGYE